MALMHCTKRNNDLLVHFKGKMTVENAVKIKKGLLKLYEQKASAYYTDFSEVTDVDITFLQLLIAFNKKLRNINSQSYIIRNDGEDKLLDELKIIGVDIKKHFLISEGNNEFTGK